MKSAAGRTIRRAYSQTARARAAEETARRIVDAFLDRLMNGWFDEITLDRVARDAGVTVQTVVRRFGGKEGLLGEAVKALTHRILSLRAAPAGEIGSIANGLIDDYEQTGDMVIRLLAVEPRHPGIAPFTDRGRRCHREWVETVFSGALEALDAPSRKRAVDALVVVTDVYAWKLLRRDMGHSASSTRAITKSLIRAILCEFTELN
ncbi:MAG TPA: TetR/AcrR family transcriptional regulator [Tepidisphaeraceae bacterium]|jgi:AcrR family transcriptional regulator|nr:TetR/AcrR family transcriptional regulator [Tepidisphaeraceae bacterium]